MKLTDKYNPLKLNTEIIAATMLLPLFLSYIETSIVFALNLKISPYLFPIALLLSIIIILIKNKITLSNVFSLFLGLLFVSGLIYLNCLYDDWSYDGNFYHQEIIVYLLDGWNPFYELSPSSNSSLWAKHYTKCLETVEACVASSIGLIEAGKAVNYMIVLGSTALVPQFLKNYFPNLSSKNIILTTIIIALNPVAMGQLPTFYIDYAAYYYVILAIIFSISFINKPNYLYSGLITSVIIFAAGTKFTSFFYVGMVMASITFYLIYKRQYKKAIRIASISLLAALIGTVFTGFHPYMTNYINLNNPLYPLVGADAVDIMVQSIPADYLNHNRFYNLIHSLFSLRIPGYDSRVGGFGFAMPLLIILSFVSLCISSSKYKKLLIYGYVMTILSSIIFKEVFWARYVPHLWLIVVFGFISCFYITSKRTRKFFKICVLCLTLVNSSAIYIVNLSFGIFETIKRDKVFNWCIQNSETIGVYQAEAGLRRHLIEKNINFSDLNNLNLNEFHQGFAYCLDKDNSKAQLILIPGDVSINELFLNKKLFNVINFSNYYVVPENKAWPNHIK